jgi:hypothetical protein
LQNNKITKTKKRTLKPSRIMFTTAITTMMFLVLVSASPSSLLLQPQQVEATAYGLGLQRAPPAAIVGDGQSSRLQLENGDPFSAEGRTPDYSKPPQATISFGERFQLLMPQFRGIFKDAQSASLTICSDDRCRDDDFRIRQELVNTRDSRLVFLQTYVINAPNGLEDTFTASDNGLKIYLFWEVSFTEGTSQTYVAIALLKGDPCEEHGWAYGRDGTICFDPNE